MDREAGREGDFNRFDAKVSLISRSATLPGRALPSLHGPWLRPRAFDPFGEPGSHPLNSRLKIFPTGVFGSSVRNSMYFGRL